MKTICLTATIAALLLFNSAVILSQTTEVKLNQVELHKQFLGSWKCEIGQDTICLIDITPFGAGFEVTRRFITKGNTFDTWKELSGYDKKADKFIGAQLKKSSTTVSLTVSWFISKYICESIPYKDISDPGKAAVKWTFEVKSPETATLTTTRNNKVVSTVTYTRIKG